MYKIIYVNVETGVRLIEYGCKPYIQKRVFYLVQSEWAEIEQIFKLCRTWNIFKKCIRRDILEG